MEMWREAAVLSLGDVAVGLFAAEGAGAATPAELPASVAGAFLPLTTSDLNVQIGLFAEEAGCITLARTLLGMEPEDELEFGSDVFDCMGEVANVLAGSLKTRMKTVTRRRIDLGLPLVVCGAFRPPGAAQVWTGASELVGVPVFISVVHA